MTTHGDRALAWLAGLCLVLPWLSPIAVGPSVNTVPWLLTAALAGIAWASLGAPAPARSALVVAVACALLGAAWHGAVLERAALAGALGLMLLGAGIGRAVGGGGSFAPVIAAGWLFAALVSACIALAQYFGVSDHLQPWVHLAAAGDALGNLRQRNQLATLMALGLAVVVWWPGLPARQGLWRAAAAVLLGVANAATMSRTGLLQLFLLAGLAFLWRGSEGRLQARVWVSAALAYAVASWLLPLLLEAVTGREAADLLGRLTSDLGCSGRTVLWANVLQLIAQRPLAGWGWGDLDYAHFLTLYPGARFCDILDNAHNLPLHIAVEAGLPLALLVCGGAVWRIMQGRPWSEAHAPRQLAWAVVAMILVHSLVEYPLWYGPFQLALGLCVGLLSAAPTDPAGPGPEAAQRRFGWRAGAACAWFAALGYVAWDYARISQIYLPPESRQARWRDDPVAHARGSWLFAEQARFAELTMSVLDRGNAAWVSANAEAALHFSPEPRVIERAIESATMLERFDEAVLHLARYRVAFPKDYASWRDVQRTQPLQQLQPQAPEAPAPAASTR